MVMFAVKSLIYGDAAAPTVPNELTHPKLKAEISAGNSSETNTKKTPQAELIKNLRIAMMPISMIVW